MHFCVGSNLPFFDKGVHYLAYFMQRTHSHGVAHSIGTRAAQKDNSIMVGLCIRISLYHRWVIKLLQCFLADTKLLVQEILDTEFECGTLVSHFVKWRCCHLVHLVKDSFTLLWVVPYVGTHQFGNVAHKHSMTVEHAHPQERKDVADGLERE